MKERSGLAGSIKKFLLFGWFTGIWGIMGFMVLLNTIH